MFSFNRLCHPGWIAAAAGTWTVRLYPGAIVHEGSGTTLTIPGLDPGTYYFTVANAEGCVSAASANAVINPRPVVPTPPVPGTVTQPSCASPTGSVTLSGLPAAGTWTLTRSPGGVTTTGTGTSTLVTGLEPGTYTYTVTNEGGCHLRSVTKYHSNCRPCHTRCADAGVNYTTFLQYFNGERCSVRFTGSRLMDPDPPA